MVIAIVDMDLVAGLLKALETQSFIWLSGYEYAVEEYENIIIDIIRITFILFIVLYLVYIYFDY